MKYQRKYQLELVAMKNNSAMLNDERLVRVESALNQVRLIQEDFERVYHKGSANNYDGRYRSDALDMACFCDDIADLLEELREHIVDFGAAAMTNKINKLNQSDEIESN